MRTYMHHLGDWASHTGALDWMECAAYHKLIEAYYISEQPLPGDLLSVFRLIAAVTRAEKEATERVLIRYFALAPDGCWHQKRCDEEIERQQRFNESQRRNIKKRWDGNDGDPVEKGKPLSDRRIPTMGVVRQRGSSIPEVPPRTSPHVNGQMADSNGNTTVIPSVIPPMTHELNTFLAAAASGRAACERAREAAAAAGIEVKATDPRLAALVADGATPGEFRLAAARATAAGKGEAWFYAALAGMRRDVATGNAQEGAKTGSGSPNYPMLPRWDDPH